MKIKLIGLGQCGSFVVYDVIAFLFDQKSSRAIKATPQTQWRRHISKGSSRIKSWSASLKITSKKFFTGLKTADIPQFFVVDGNRKNAVVDGLLGEEINKKLGPLQVLVAALSLADRNNGCNLGQVGEYAFRKEKGLGPNSKVFTRLKSTDQIEINALVFAGGGGSGSGGAPVLNEELRSKESLLFNMLVLPPYHISDRRQRWNTGRCIMRLSKIHNQTALLLFSNLSESLNDQYYVNKYISKLIVRLANFGYTGNVPKVATDVDRKDLQVFFSGKPAFVGMSSLEKGMDDPSKEEIEKMVDQALAPRTKQEIEGQEFNEENISGLSIEVPAEAVEKMMLHQIKMVMIVIGLTPKYEGKVNMVDIVKRRIEKQLSTSLGNLDCRAYSYTSPSEIELTIFLRLSNNPPISPLAPFLKSYFDLYEGEANEFTYLKNILGKEDNDFLETIQCGLEEEVDTANPNWLQAFDFPIDKELGATYSRKKKETITSTPPGD